MKFQTNMNIHSRHIGYTDNVRPHTLRSGHGPLEVVVRALKKAHIYALRT